MMSGEDRNGRTGPVRGIKSARSFALDSRNPNPLPTYGDGRQCSADQCSTILRRTREGAYCGIHEHIDTAEPPKRPVHRSARHGEFVDIADVAPIVLGLIADRGSIDAAAAAIGISVRNIPDRARPNGRTNRRCGVKLATLDKILNAAGLEHRRREWACFA